MATANVMVKIEGLEALQALVARLEELVAQVEKIGRPIYGDVHISQEFDYESFADAAAKTRRLDGLNGRKR